MTNEPDRLRGGVAELEAFQTKCEKLEESLRQSEERFSALFHAASNPIAITTVKEGRIVDLNAAYASLICSKREELIGLSTIESGLLADPGQREMIARKLREEGRIHNVEEELRTKTGEIRTILLSAVPITVKEEPCLLGIAVDITETKKAQAALCRSEKLLSDILDGSPIPQMVIGKDHRIIKWNRALEEYSGIRANDVVGTDQQWRPFYKEKRPLMADLLADGAVEKIPQLYAGKYAKSKLVDGAYEATDFFPEMGENGKWLYFTASAIKDSNGNIAGAMEILEDVTEQRRAEEALKESQEYLNQIINSIRDPIFVKDREHNFILANDALCTFAGKPRETLLGKGSFESLPVELTETLWKHEEEVFNSGAESLTEDTINDPKGNTHILLTKKSLLVDKKGNHQIIGVLRDITEYKRLEAQLFQSQKIEAIGLLAGGVAHDFNNLLNVIIGYSDMALQDLSPDNPARKDVEEVLKAGKRAATLTSQLLAFSRKQILQPEIINLNETVAEMGTLLHRLIGEDIDLITVNQPGLRTISADPAQIQQIIMNLAVNARDAMPKGGKIIIETANVDFDEDSVRRHQAMKSGPYVMLAISDNGIGMDSAIQSRIFEPFFTTKGKDKGTGLGLSTVYGIVKQSNGFIWVYSEPGKGASFKIYFPRAEDEIPTKKAEIKSEHKNHGVETVLVVEDEASVRALACRILRDKGYSVFEASNGLEALQIARDLVGEIHLVVTDVVMPGMSGNEMVSQLEAIRPGNKALFMSGYTDKAIVHHGVLDSNVAFLQKPFTAESLACKVREALDA